MIRGRPRRHRLCDRDPLPVTLERWTTSCSGWLPSTLPLLVNAVPAFMPPTWAVLAVFHATTGIPLFALTIPGAAASALGRVGLAYESRALRRYIPASDRANAGALAGFVDRHCRWRFAAVFLYCLGPFPSNPLFIAAGVGRVPLFGVTVAFFLSRSIADTFWVWTTTVVTRNVGDVFRETFTSWQALAVQFAGIALVVLVLRLPWARWLPGVSAAGRPSPRHPSRPASA